MGWGNSDTEGLKQKIAKFASTLQPPVTPRQLASALRSSGTGCLLGEAGCEGYLARLVEEAAKRNPSAFVAFKAKQNGNLYEKALKEAGMLVNQNGTQFTPQGVAFLWDACGILEHS